MPSETCTELGHTTLDTQTREKYRIPGHMVAPNVQTDLPVKPNKPERKKPVPPKRVGLRGEYWEALELQRTITRTIREREGIEPGDLASLVRAWDTLREAKRILRNKPLPGSLKPEQPKPKAKLPLSIVPPTD